jgi:hypothetical protein
MKKTAILFLSLASIGVLQAQNDSRIAPTLEVQYESAKKVTHNAQPESSTVFWSEDFANGIPTGWSQNGSSANALWEYRGPGSAPSNSVGSIGQFSGKDNTPPTNDPLASSTTSNGFVIFDSDFLDNAGLPNNAGNGTAPAPHVGRLQTSVIDLSNEAGVELKFESYARRFQANFFVAFSTDGGLTFTDTLEVYPEDDIAVNASTDNGIVTALNVSNIIGSEANAVIQFIFDGTPGNANGNGYYYWMLDDIELRTPPVNSLRLTAAAGAPAIDMVYNPTVPQYPKYGHLNSNQIVPIAFDANLYNYGTATQTNVGLEVEIWDANTLTQITTLTTPTCATLAPLDTCDFNTLTTPTWTPPTTTGTDRYLIVYKAISDSVTSAITDATDTLDLIVSDDLYSLDRGNVSNFVGTNSSTNDVLALGNIFDLTNEDPDSAGSGLVFLEGITVNMSSLTDSTADIEVAIYDTTGFSLGASGGFTAGPIFSRVYSLDPSAPGNPAYFFDFTQEDSLFNPATLQYEPARNPLAVPVGPYYVLFTFFPNATDGVVRVANDATIGQPNTFDVPLTIMQVGTGQWFTGFTSPTFEGPHFRLGIADAPAWNISLTEADMNDFSVYPNPTNGNGNIQFDMGGTYTIKVMDMVGNILVNDVESVNANQKVSLDLNNIPAGVYLVNVEGEGISKTVKITVQ